MNNQLKNQQGFIALIAVLIIVSVTLSIGLSLNILSINETQSSLIRQNSTQTFGIVDGCAREAYLRVERDNNYAGGSLNIGQGSCIITVVPQGTDRIITIESDVNNSVRKIETSVDVTSSNIFVNYWLELI